MGIRRGRESYVRLEEWEGDGKDKVENRSGQEEGKRGEKREREEGKGLLF